MIITITGVAGSGKSTVAKILAKKLGFKHYSTGDYMREMAKKQGLTIIELSKQAETHKAIDEELDEWQTKLGKEGDDFVLEARLGWHFIPDSIKIFLDVSEEEGARRIFEAKRKGEKYPTQEALLEELRKRKASESKRYMQLYGADCYDKEHYDLLIDTTEIPANEVVEKIIAFLKKLEKA